jgi:hypothetical protein
VVATLLPLTLIVAALTALNLEHAVFNIMSGNREATPNDGAYFVVLLLSLISVFAVPVLLVAYAALWWLRRKTPLFRSP